ncbi:MAG: hypothetical protein JRH17_01880 [Deltaproteobacteria bacterium]|nr:hypothetical protein [Deltaproteobacteria bacterium]
MDASGIKDRASWFASLQAAHRALARSVHPSQLAGVKDQSRELLIQLQALSGGAPDAGDGMASSDPSRLRSIDAALAEQTRRLLEVVRTIDVSQLRATLPQLVLEHREEVIGLLDVLLEDDLSDGTTLRTLEYVITMLSAEERGGRRICAQEPSQVSARLARCAAEQQGTDREEACLMAERVLEDATVQVMQDGDIGAIRDRVRRYKEELGSGILHPRVLAASIAYNVAMWNHTAAEIDSSRAIEQLAEELFSEQGPTPRPAISQASPAQAKGQQAIGQMTVGPALRGSENFNGLVQAFRKRARGQSAADNPATRLAGTLPLEMLRAEDVDLFEEESPDEATALMRHAIVLGLLLRSRQGIGAELTESGLDIESLATDYARDLSERMSDLARKLFANSEYAEAFKLSDVKTHSLAAFTARSTAPDPASPGSRGASKRRPQAETHSALSIVFRQLTSGPWLATLLLIGIVVGVLFAPPILDTGPSREERLAAISPFLTSGHENQQADPRRFVGYLSPTWDYVGTAERRIAVDEIGRRLAEQGVPRVVLMNQGGDVLARYINGEILLLVEREPSEQAE